MTTLRRISVHGFRSLRAVHLETLGPVTVLIGPNGAGKSNLLDFFRLLTFLVRGSLRRFVGEAGGASALLYYGPKVTSEISFQIEYEVTHGLHGYHAKLGYAANDTLIFLDEQVGAQLNKSNEYTWHSLGSGHAESMLNAHDAIVTPIFECLRRTTYMHVHDTSARSPMRANCRAEDYRDLRPDGSNLAAYLLALKNGSDAGSQVAWRRITQLSQQVAPCIKELLPEYVEPPFALDVDFFDTSTAGAPRPSAVRLDWIDNRDEIFGPAQLSDGTLRAIALITALARPTARLPLLLSIDEPELGLHPAALALLCDLVDIASRHCQILLATQSPALLDDFEPQQVVVTERVDDATQLRRLDPVQLQAWLKDYTLSELFDKNVLGGRP